MNDEPRPPEPEDEKPKPATWAGRKRAEDADEQAPPEEREAAEPQDAEPEAAEETEAAEPEPEAEPEAEAGQAAEAGAEAESEGPPEPTQETVEADTLALADREAAEEAAHAGLRARTAEEATKRGLTPPPAPAVPPPATPAGAAAAATPAPAAVPVPMDVGEPPKRNLWWRFVVGGMVVISSIAAATAVAFLLFLTDIGNDLKGDDAFARGVEGSLASIEGDEPQTILIIGSDKRTTASGDPGRSDTTMLLRVDPDKEYLALLSLPRDLRVEIPGYGTDKLNAAYSWGEQYEPKEGGGSAVTLRTVRQLLGIDINHIVNINFEGFYDVVNAIGCVYIDVDRHYYNPVGGEYDDIDIQAGYQKLCGYLALDYVRYRHNDNDIVRGARQQNFVTQARQQIPPRDLLPFLPGSNGDELIEIFTKYTTSDIDDPPTIIEMLKSFVDVRNAPVRRVELENTFETINGVSYVVATQEQINKAVDQFLGRDLEAPPAEPTEPADGAGGGGGGKDKKGKPSEPAPPEMIDVTGAAQQYAAAFQRELERDKVKLPVYYPTQIAAKPSTSITDESRGSFQIPGPDGEIYRGYKFVVSYVDPECCNTYYGVSGTDWKDPPILNNPTETREIDGRDYLLFYDRDRLRLVGWKTSKGSYWVINTLTQSLSESEMLAVATSTRELGD